jgi:hypothetical protein
MVMLSSVLNHMFFGVGLSLGCFFTDKYCLQVKHNN